MRLQVRDIFYLKYVRSKLSNFHQFILAASYGQSIIHEIAEIASLSDCTMVSSFSKPSI